MSSGYGSNAGADAYHLERGNTLWAGSDDQKSAARLRGSEYIDGNFRAYFAGIKVGARAQEREWPRSGAYDRECNSIPSDEIPIEAINASYEAALRELVKPGSLSPDFVPGKQVKRERVDVIEVEYSGAATGAAAFKPVMSVVAGILAPILVETVGARTERV